MVFKMLKQTHQMGERHSGPLCTTVLELHVNQQLFQIKFKLKKCISWDFPGDPVVKTLCFQHRGCRFDHLSGNQIPTCCMAEKGKKQRKKKLGHGSQGKTIKETKETWQLNAMWNSELKYFVIWDIIGQDLNEVWGLNGSNLPVLISLFWHFSMV